MTSTASNVSAAPFGLVLSSDASVVRAPSTHRSAPRRRAHTGCAKKAELAIHHPHPTTFFPQAHHSVDAVHSNFGRTAVLHILRPLARPLHTTLGPERTSLCALYTPPLARYRQGRSKTRCWGERMYSCCSARSCSQYARRLRYTSTSSPTRPSVSWKSCPMTRWWWATT